MAARMSKNQDLYLKIRDEALADYTKRHPNPSSYDAKMKTVISIFAYLCIWGDYYGEGLWQKGANDCWDLRNHNIEDPLVPAFIYTKKINDQLHAITDKAAQWESADLDHFLAADFPAAMKTVVAKAALTNLLEHKRWEHAGSDEICLQAIPHFVGLWGENYRELIRQRYPNRFLYDFGATLLSKTQSDENTLARVSVEIDRSFNEVDSSSPVKLELDGEFYIDDAWNVRGDNFARSVHSQDWPVMKERLDQAAAILEPLYSRYPNEMGTCLAMMEVELGQGKGRDRLEMWFQRAIKIDPDDEEPYYSKAWYLQPRWYGSVDDLLAFGEECVKTGNWKAKVPLVLPKALKDVSQFDPGIYRAPSVWPVVESIYREYLSRFPDSTRYRTRFVKAAYLAGQMDIVREQLQLLGKKWDRTELSEKEHAEIIAEHTQ